LKEDVGHAVLMFFRRKKGMRFGKVEGIDDCR